MRPSFRVEVPSDDLLRPRRLGQRGSLSRRARWIENRFYLQSVGWCKSLWHSGLYLVWTAVRRTSIIARRGRVKTHPASERSAFRLFRQVEIWRSRAGSVGQRAFAPDGRDSTSTLRYMDAAVRRNEGKLCFVKRKSKDLVSNCRRFCEKNISIFEKRERLNKNLWTFLRNASSFLCFLPAFLKRHPSLRSRCHPWFPHPHLRTRERTRPCASRTQRVRNSCLHPSPSPTSR